MKNKCYTAEAKEFENKLNEYGITIEQFKSLTKMWDNLSLGGQAECGDLLKNVSLEKVYPVTFLADECETVYVKMTENEAAIIERVLNEANEQKSKTGAYCGSVIFSADEGMTDLEFTQSNEN